MTSTNIQKVANSFFSVQDFFDFCLLRPVATGFTGFGQLGTQHVGVFHTDAGITLMLRSNNVARSWKMAKRSQHDNNTLDNKRKYLHHSNPNPNKSHTPCNKVAKRTQHVALMLHLFRQGFTHFETFGERKCNSQKCIKCFHKF